MNPNDVQFMSTVLTEIQQRDELLVATCEHNWRATQRKGHTQDFQLAIHRTGLFSVLFDF
ncbi:hypothetical protein F2P79_012300 [Pimephales promelas]|nr:hypothetical protein F2P79_012300 [Pimephales promelas]